MSQSSDGPTIDFRTPETAPTLTRLGDDGVPRPAPANFAPPGYEILGELGRGGMGVVYRARQKSLNRLVALKVILGAGHAGTEQLARFRAEATTAAQLQHANIVQIFEVGEHDGQPFFSLELVEGGSLADRLRGEPQPPRETAELIRVLALAVDHAHSKGVIHRDLKPANVLLQSAIDNRQSAVPKITDFGLAKQRATESGLTASGAVLGTPSYMAPEQAAGRGAAVGPATDVYALGAILYEMLTGRPPFRGPTVMDTMLQVMGDEPVPPSRLQPKVPRDLETICLKCLAKKPEQRYVTAAALADDLGRFLAGETILARPTSTLRKATKWATRHPALATVVFIFAVPLPALLATMVYLWIDAREAKRQIESEKAAVVHAHAQAEREREIAQQYLQNALGTMDRILDRVGDERLMRIPAIQEVRTAIMGEALGFFETLLRIDSSDPQVRQETAQTFARMSRVNLMGGRIDQAAKAGQGSVELYKGLSEQYPDRPEFRNELAQAYMFLGHSLILNSDFAGGLQAYAAGAEIAEALGREFPDEPSYRATAAECRRSLGYFHANAGGAGGESDFKESLRLAEELYQKHPEKVEYQALLSSVLGSYSQLLVLRGKVAEAAPLVARGFALPPIARESLPRSGSSRLHFDLGAIQLRMAAAYLQLRTKKNERGLELLREATAGYEGLIASQPQAFPFRLQVVQAYTTMARVLSESRDFDAALKASDRARELFDEMVRDFPVFADPTKAAWFHNQRYAAIVQNASHYLDANRPASARPLAEQLDAATSLNGGMAYNVACLFARLSATSAGEQRERDAVKAMSWLRKAAATGYPATEGQIEHIRKTDDDLTALRSRPEFQEWVKTLAPSKK